MSVGPDNCFDAVHRADAVDGQEHLAHLVRRAATHDRLAEAAEVGLGDGGEAGPAGRRAVPEELRRLAVVLARLDLVDLVLEVAVGLQQIEPAVQVIVEKSGLGGKARKFQAVLMGSFLKYGYSFCIRPLIDIKQVTPFQGPVTRGLADVEVFQAIPVYIARLHRPMTQPWSRLRRRKVLRVGPQVCEARCWSEGRA